MERNRVIDHAGDAAFRQALLNEVAASFIPPSQSDARGPGAPPATRIV